jgi:hypothetical protein
VSQLGGSSDGGGLEVRIGNYLCHSSKNESRYREEPGWPPGVWHRAPLRRVAPDHAHTQLSNPFY